MDDDRTGVADITLERYRLNELSPRDAVRVEERLRHDARLRSRLDALRESDERLHAGGDLERLASGIRLDLDRRRPVGATAWFSRPLSRWAAGAAAAAGVALALFLAIRPPAPDGEHERIKGLQATVSVFRQVKAGSETLADNAVVRSGDVLRVGYHAAGRRYGMILSIDGRRHVTVHFPGRGASAAPLEHQPTALLDHAYELDDAPRGERFYFVTANEPFPVAPVVAAAERAAAEAGDGIPAALPLAAGLEQSIFSLWKGSQP